MASQTESRVLLDARSVFWLVGIAFCLWFIVQVREVLFILFISGMLASALYPVVLWLRARHLPEHVGVLLLYLLIILVLGSTGFVLGSVLLEQGQQLSRQLPDFMTSALAFLHRHLTFLPTDETMLATLTRQLQTLSSQAFNVLLSTVDYLFMVFTSVLSIVMILVITFYLLIDVEYFEQSFLGLVPVAERARVDQLLKMCAHKIGAYVRGQFVLMTVIGVIIWLGLLMIGVPYAFVLGVVSFLLEIIPVVGPILAAMCGVLVALGSEPTMALWALGLYFLVQQAENYFLAPRILGGSVGIHPFWVLLSILIGGTVAGLIGVLLAVPITVIGQIMLDEFYINGFLKRKNAGDDMLKEGV